MTRTYTNKNPHTGERKYEQYDLCSKNKTCIFYNLYNCSKKSLKTFDLKEFYNNCQEEAPIQNFKADLLLNDITKKYKSPILIEILVTHKCSDEKINSGLKIIEIKIDSESDIRTLLNLQYLLVFLLYLLGVVLYLVYSSLDLMYLSNLERWS